MSHCQSIKLKMCCPSTRPSSSVKQISSINVEQLYKQFSETLQRQLSALQTEKSKQIDILNEELHRLKMSVTRLESRTKVDQQNQSQLRKEYQQLLQKYNNLNITPTRQIEVIERIKEVKVIESDPQKDLQIDLLGQKCEEINIQLGRIRVQKELIGQQNAILKERFEYLKNSDRQHQLMIKQLQSATTDKNLLIEKLKNQIIFLKANKQIVVQTKRQFPNFHPIEKNSPAQVQIVHIQKPVQKIVFVDVLRKVTQFVEPQKAVVNRIISCESQSQSKKEPVQDTYHQSQNIYLNEVIGQMERKINSYHSEREQLVGIINSKNAEMNSLQNKTKFQRSSNEGGNISSDNINVTVTKLKQKQIPSREAPLKNQTVDKQKVKPKKV